MGFTAFFVRIGVFTYLSDILTLPPYEYGDDVIAGYLSLPGLGGLLAGEIAGYLTDKVGRWRTALMGFATLALVLAAFMSDHWIDYLAILLLFQGIFSTTATTALNTMIVEVDPARRATASSIYGSLRFLGYALAPALLYPAYKYDLLQGVALVCVGLLLLALLTGIIVSKRLT